jgi:hypothetical protein
MTEATMQKITISGFVFERLRKASTSKVLLNWSSNPDGTVSFSISEETAAMLAEIDPDIETAINKAMSALLSL